MRQGGITGETLNFFEASPFDEFCQRSVNQTFRQDELSVKSLDLNKVKSDEATCADQPIHKYMHGTELTLVSVLCFPYFRFLSYTYGEVCVWRRTFFGRAHMSPRSFSLMRRNSLVRVAGLLMFVLVPPVLRAAESSNLTELKNGWRLTSVDNVSAGGEQISKAEFDASTWHSVKHMPSTVLQALEDDGVYKDLYSGMNLAKVGDLWKKDWWYRTTFVAPPGRSVYTLIFKGINYRAEVWLNGRQLAGA
jgi:hypothetical protein